ncbi:serine/threonine protein kinase [Pseudomarimonas arenosa]|uniref:Serine/threonine protein kinase n=1 Tax=Pseudomarimonas arenosa TaxID=2774145 RepID=A0AAW3ZKC5_9GAMM|nr:serine/threonine-protein kinase [Pseudomarimonas arenosa]MBD8525964.1 serine/threonine protein kinase [Pseudomarimonas arenosa]
MTSDTDLEQLQSAFEALVALNPDDQGRRLADLENAAPALAAKLRRLIELDAEYEAAEQQRPVSLADSTTLPTLPGYEVLDLVGSGGMGQVYRAIQCNDAQRVVRAVKVLHSERSPDQLRERFEAECKVLSELDHPNIARYIASGFSEKGAPYVVMEFVDGEPIDRWCDARGKTLAQRVALVRQLLAALQHAHQRLIVHRDIKPNNVLVDASGKLFLVDFGIAKRLADASSASATVTSDRFLSLLSAAPEQLSGKAASTATDVYAVGLLLFRLLSGNDPFTDSDDASPVRYQQRVLDAPAPSMASRVKESDTMLATSRRFASVADWRRALRGDLGRVVLRCLRKSPEERYADAGSLDRDLRAVLEGWPISERESEPVYRLRKFVGRHRPGVALAGLAALLLAGLWWNAELQRARALHERDRAEAATRVLTQSFAAANPLGVSGGDARVSHVLDASREQLHPLREEQPELFATLSATLAEVELSAGRPSEALQLTRDALGAVDETASDEWVRRLRQLKARAQLEAGELTDLQAELDVLPRSSVRDRVEHSILLGRFAYLQSDLDAAVGHLQIANSLSSQLADDDALKFEARIFLAQALRLNEQPAQAIEVLDNTLASLSHRFAVDHPRIVLTQLRRIELQRGFAPADRLLQEVNALTPRLETVFGTRSAPYARLLGLRAQIQRQAGEHVASLSSYRAAWQAWSAATAPGHPNSLRALFNLAFISSRLEQPPETVDALYLRLMDDAKAGIEQDSSIHNYWRVSYLEFLVDQQKCTSALRVAGAELVAQPHTAFNPPTLKLLSDVVDKLTRRCDCPAATSTAASEATASSLAADPERCAALPRLSALAKAEALAASGNH